MYKLLADAPDPYPLLEAAVVRLVALIQIFMPNIAYYQDQAVKVTEAEMLESELKRLREDNADLRKRVAEIPNIEAAAKKAEARAEILEDKVNSSQRTSYA